MNELLAELEEELECAFDADTIDGLETGWQDAVANGETISGLKDWIKNTGMS